MDDEGAARPATVPSDLRERVRAVMEAHWREVDGAGFTVPNARVYPWQWLWDSCFHSIIWAELGDADRALRELSALFAHQDDDGFVPHVTHHGDPTFHADFWGRAGTSSITQPPMYGHALAELHRRGVAVPSELVERARAGLEFLLRVRRRDDESGLITVVHPWETGADDSPRWDDLCPGGFDVARWKQVKGDLLATVERTAGGAPVANPAFAVAPVSFNALVLFNLWELWSLHREGDEWMWGLARTSSELTTGLDDRWDDELVTWVDGGPTADGSGRVRTSDALLATLARPHEDREAAAVRELFDPAAFGAACGPTQVHRAEPAYDPNGYWRGATWPQVNYLHWVCARAEGRGHDRRLVAEAERLAASTIAGATTSGLAEYWHPDTGAGLGAIPQSWTGLSLVMGRPPQPGREHGSGGAVSRSK